MANENQYECNNIQSQLGSLGFKTFEEISGRSSLSDLFAASKRCGIYVLHFENDWYYVGQSVNVVRRYNEHRHNHVDIQKISFKPTLQRNLNHEELATICALEETGRLLRNISLASIPHGETDFDNIMSLADQEKWLNDLTYTDFSGTRALALQLRERYARNYVHYQRMPYSDQITKVLRTYVRRCIPIPIRSELAFWSSTCLPSYGNADIRLYSRINVYWQEVCTALVADDTVCFSWHLAASPFDSSSIDSILATYPTAEMRDHGYKSGGSDQFNLTVETVKEAMRILDDENIVKAIRLFNLRLCRKGGCNNSQYHCFDLADELLGINNPMSAQ